MEIIKMSDIIKQENCAETIGSQNLLQCQEKLFEKRKCEPLSLRQKMEVIRLSKNGASERSLAEKFNCSKTQIHSTIVNEPRYRKEWEEIGEDFGHLKSSHRVLSYKAVNDLMYQWYQKRKEQSTEVTTTEIQEKAMALARTLKLINFNAGNGWLESFRKTIKSNAKSNKKDQPSAKQNWSEITDFNVGNGKHENVIKFYNNKRPESYHEPNSNEPKNSNDALKNLILKYENGDDGPGQPQKLPRLTPRPPVPSSSKPATITKAATITKPSTSKLPSATPRQSTSSPTPSTDSEVCVRWNNHHSNMQSTFPNLMDKQQYVDVTLAADGNIIKCHKLILSSCSPYFDEMLQSVGPMQHPIIFLKDMEFWQIKALVEFMYKGEVNIDQNNLESLLQAAEVLQIKGFARKSNKKEPEIIVDEPELPFSDEETILRPDSPMRDDTKDEDYTPTNEYRKRYAAKKARKRKAFTPPDSTLFKTLPINLKGTKSRPNIKQPKYYDPDYPDMESTRCVSPPKIDIDPLFHIDNVKIEPIDIEMPPSPTYYSLDNPLDIETMDTGFKQDDSKNTPAEDQKKKSKLEKSLMKSADTTAEPKSVLENTSKTYLKVRNLPTTESVLKKFASNNLTSILKRAGEERTSHIIIKKIDLPDRSVPKTNPSILKKIVVKPAILKNATKITKIQANIVEVKKQVTKDPEVDESKKEKSPPVQPSISEQKKTEDEDNVNVT